MWLLPVPLCLQVVLFFFCVVIHFLDEWEKHRAAVLWLYTHAQIPRTPTSNNKSHRRQDAVGVFVLLCYTLADIVLHTSWLKWKAVTFSQHLGRQLLMLFTWGRTCDRLHPGREGRGVGRESEESVLKRTVTWERGPPALFLKPCQPVFVSSVNRPRWNSPHALAEHNTRKERG